MDQSVFDNFKATLKNGGVQAVSAPELFATPSDVAARMVELAAVRPEHRILEPSAGTGHILWEIPLSCLDVVAVELSFTLAEGLRSSQEFSRCDIRQGDFLELADRLGRFDRVIMNPPFSNAADIRHIQTAFGLLNEGGVLVALCANGPRQQRVLKDLAEQSGGFYEALPAGTFKNAGTMVNAALLVAHK